MRELAFPAFFLPPTFYFDAFKVFPDSVSPLASHLVLSVHGLSDGSTWSTAGGGLGLGGLHTITFYSTQAFLKSGISFYLPSAPAGGRATETGWERERGREREREGEMLEGQERHGHSGEPDAVAEVSGCGEDEEVDIRKNGKTDYPPPVLFYIKKAWVRGLWQWGVLGCCKLKIFSSPVIPWFIYFHSKQPLQQLIQSPGVSLAAAECNVVFVFWKGKRAVATFEITATPHPVCNWCPRTERR